MQTLFNFSIELVLLLGAGCFITLLLVAYNKYKSVKKLEEERTELINSFNELLAFTEDLLENNEEEITSIKSTFGKHKPLVDKIVSENLKLNWN